ncbi:prepilin-type N-terminal cleavage/methylation domain-containing protein [Neobacillus rhizosphaerae]|uniref:prepilin-type N-terminal cleavage/methylation domain-containing protein n=1 Tax=Neobacillus rhizosphaerae TaxID=2880965 RepID=UPI003D2A0AA6
MFQKLKNKLKDQRGLTLIELLAVIVILGIIAAIAIPTISGVIDRSKDDAKVAEALQILDAARLAHTDDSTKTSWVYNSSAGAGVDKEPLSKYISKVKDKDFTVNYNATTNTFTITGHESASVVKSTYNDSSVVTEDELATAAR